MRWKTLLGVWKAAGVGDPSSDDKGPVPVTLFSSAGVESSAGGSGALTDRSGTITLGGTSQQAAAANAARRYLLIENVSTGDLWVNFGTAAVAAQPSIRLSAGGSYEPAFVPTATVNIIGATTGQAFVCKEG